MREKMGPEKGRTRSVSFLFFGYELAFFQRIIVNIVCLLLIVGTNCQLEFSQKCLNCSNCIPEIMKNSVVNTDATQVEAWIEISTITEVENIANYIINNIDPINFTTYYVGLENDDFFQVTNCLPGKSEGDKLSQGFGLRLSKLFCTLRDGNNLPDDSYYISVAFKSHSLYNHSRVCYYFMNPEGTVHWDYLLTGVCHAYSPTSRPWYTLCENNHWSDVYEFSAGGSGITFCKKLSTLGIVAADIDIAACEGLNETKFEGDPPVDPLDIISLLAWSISPGGLAILLLLICVFGIIFSFIMFYVWGSVELKRKDAVVFVEQDTTTSQKRKSVANEGGNEPETKLLKADDHDESSSHIEKGIDDSIELKNYEWNLQ